MEVKRPLTVEDRGTSKIASTVFKEPSKERLSWSWGGGGGGNPGVGVAVKSKTVVAYDVSKGEQV